MKKIKKIFLVKDMKYFWCRAARGKDAGYLTWMQNLPRYYVEGNTIFVHTGIDGEAEDLWEWGTDDYTFTEKYPVQTGRFYNDMKIVAGHIGTAEISLPLYKVF